MTHPIGVLRQRQCMRANHYADGQIAQHGRQFEGAANDHTQNGSQQV
jgi:hypothetical protein